MERDLNYHIQDGPHMLLGADVLLAPEGDIQAPTYKLTTFSVSIVAFVICAFLNQRGAQPQGQYQRVHIYIYSGGPTAYHRSARQLLQGRSI